MKKLIAFYVGRIFLLWILAFVSARTSAQSFVLTGTNLPGVSQDHAIPLGVGTTNLSIAVGGTAGAYSHLLLKQGVPPADEDYDQIASQNGTANAINIEMPEFRLTNYVLRVRTPAGSLTHNYTVTVLTNAPDIRSAARPATKPLVSTNQGTLTFGNWHYYRVEITTNLPGWRVMLTSTNTSPDLYIQRDSLPGTASYIKRSQSLTNDDLAFATSELPPGAYFIGVYQSTGSGSYTLRTEVINFTQLVWDPGLTHLGTQVYTNTGTNAGDYFFRITTQNTTVGAWRTALNVSTGEANIYLAKGSPPSQGSNLYKSERAGADGFVVPSPAFNAGEEWYYYVRAESGAQWTLVSGEPHVTDLGSVATDGSSGSGNVIVGAEGMRFFQTVPPVNAVAWRLWLNGNTNTVYVKKTGVAFAGSTDLSQPGQMLVVPSYLVGGQLYFVGVNGTPGTTINLDSRLQAFTDIPFASATNLVVSGFGYTTFRIQVPPDQLAWQMSVVVSNGNPNLAVRRNFIPNEANNDAYSEVPGDVTDSITLVPPTLSDGTFFITVYGTNAHSCTLQSGTPEFTEIDFNSATINADTNRVGWRFFKLSNINQQLGALGWDLYVTNFAPGTRIALRRNAAPGIWNYRNPAAGTAGTYDFLSAGDFLQRPGHQADVWYVGVFTTTNSLGAFTLVTQPLTPDPLVFDNGQAARVSVPPGKWQYFRVDVPADVLGWDLRLTNVVSGQPQLVVRRELLPASLINIGFSPPILLTNWPAGNQWAAGADWTARNFSPDGAVNENGRVLTMGYNRPLESATYYIGVSSPVNSTNELSYTIVSRGIGAGRAIPVQDLDYLGGNATNSALAARDVSVYRLMVPTNVSSWKVRMAATSGDSILAIAKDRIPNITAPLTGSVTNAQTAGKKMLKSGNEHFVLLPGAGATNILSGTYYLLVASEGLVGGDANRIGTGAAGHVLQSIGPIPEIDLGLLDTNDLVYAGTLEGGESAALHFHNHPFPTTLGFELSLEDRVGNPVMVTRSELDLPNPGAASTGGGGVPAETYGNEGGQADFLQASGGYITASGVWVDETIMLKARLQSGDYPDASYTLRIRKLIPTPVDFDGGTATVAGQTNIYEFFQVDVPANAEGWDVRLTNAPSGLPTLIANHGFLPLNVITSGWNPGTAANWPFGGNWIAAKDWTERTFSPNGSINQDGQILAMGMGRPLEPGRYYVAVRNPAYPLPVSYTVSSRGIGTSNSIPVMDLPFAGGSITNTNLPARDAAYYRVIIPPNAKSWRAKLTTLTGECMLVMLTNNIPSVLSGKGSNVGKDMQKTGNEHLVMLPVSPQLVLTPGTNYFAVVSEGVGATNATRIGADSSSFVIESFGELAVADLGTAGTSNLTYSAAQEGGEVRAYQFTVPPGMTSLEVQLENPTGNPAMVLRVGGDLPNPGAASSLAGAGSVAAEEYGNEGGYTITAGTGNANTNLISVANPAEGLYTVMVKARASTGTTFTNASYTLVVRATTYVPVGFDGGSVVVTNHMANTWRYYRVEVPTNALGWDLRLTSVISGLPKLVVARDVLPVALSTAPWSSPGTTTNWPTTNRWAAGADWTRRSSSADGLVVEDNRLLAMGMGQPLEPGTYYLGVINSAGATEMNYTLLSRGIGDGMSLPVTDLNFSGGSATVSNLAPREAAYFRVQVPTNTPGWKMKLTSVGGEAMLLVLSNRVPNVDSGRLSGPFNGKFLQKAGDEYNLLLPAIGQSNIIAGTYYLAAVSEGINPATATRIGSGSSTFTVTSDGNVQVQDLGVLGVADIVTTTTLSGGDSRIYQFSVPPTAPAIEMRLENRTGNPVMVVITNASVPDPGGASSPRDSYGNDGGSTPSGINTNILTIANPTNGIYTLAVKARAFGTAYPDASYTLRVRQLPVPELNFTAELNTNGLNNVASGLLLDNQRTYYKVVVPTNVNGQPIIGWQLDLSQTSGQAGMRVRKDALPSDAVTGIPFTANAAVIAPPVLTNGTWYVEVRGTNSTSYTLTSSALALQRPAWQMPGNGEPIITPGLTAPDFGDSGVDTNGVTLAGDGGIDLELGRYHYYAIVVPTNNSGLFRVQLEGISGNPDFYLRPALVPTLTHSSNGLSGNTLERALTSSATDYGNFVPLNGKTETRLQPGIWYLAVQAVANANARYRLKLSAGSIQDIALNGGTVTNQVLAGTDWRYYRVQVPADLPGNWSVTFNQEAGDVVMHVRDTIPPGNGTTTAAGQYKDWASDAKNDGPYANYDPPGSYTFNVPPLRPGSVYYLGFRAKNDAIFSLTSSTGGNSNPPPPIIEFYGGSVTNTIPPNSQISYRVLTPTNAIRWRYTAIHSNTVTVYVENGTFPVKSTTDDFRSVGANSTLDRHLTVYPWLAGQTYYMTVTNPTAFPQFFNINMIGSNTSADDDADGMLDVWELFYFGTITASANGDNDVDGVSNLNEFLDGTNPTDKTSFRPRLIVLATNGVVAVSPAAPSYMHGDIVALTPTANAGYSFRGWSGSVTGTAVPLVLTMDTNKTVIPRFRVPGDDFEQRITLVGAAVTHSGLQNVGATKEPGEPNHAGNAGGKSLWWTWTAPVSGTVSLTTAGSNFRNALAAYTGGGVSNLTVIATNLAGIGTNTSQVTFSAVIGTTYHFAVDGYNGASGNVVLNLSQPAGNISLSQPVRGSDGFFRFTILSAPGLILRVDATTNLVTWTTLSTVTNVTGMMVFTDTNSPNFALRFYRVVLPGLSDTSLRLVDAVRLPDGQFRFTVIGPAGQIARVEATTNPALTNWTTLGSITNVSGTNLYTDSGATNFTKRFYRAVSP